MNPPRISIDLIDRHPDLLDKALDILDGRRQLPKPKHHPSTEPTTPKSMRPFDFRTATIRKDGKICLSLNGGKRA